MIFDQLATNTTVFLYQFMFPFAAKIDKLTTVKAQLKRLKNLQPRNSKSKQSSFKKLYIKIWKQILVIPDLYVEFFETGLLTFTISRLKIF